MNDERFLSRWLRLKRRAATAESADPAVPARPVRSVESDARVPVVTEATSPDVASDPAPDTAPNVETDPLADLPSVEDLTAESDFTPFLRAEVPDDLHRQALRKLWTSDPVYANDDGLKDYAEDYASLFTGGDPVKTLYRVGRGFLTEDADSSSSPREEGEGELPPDPANPSDALPSPGETPRTDSVLTTVSPPADPLLRAEKDDALSARV